SASRPLAPVRQSVTGCTPTQSMGTITIKGLAMRGPFFFLKFDEVTAPNQGIQPNVRTDYSLENGYFALLTQ
ncbi:hypothetical protein, partial [Pseudomonas lactis]|uniref:hypothetical protein n=1 Tax=Pseudomonas lactis TaxID=1615674 RepID=UPI001CC21020